MFLPVDNHCYLQICGEQMFGFMEYRWLQYWPSTSGVDAVSVCVCFAFVARGHSDFSLDFPIRRFLGPLLIALMLMFWYSMFLVYLQYTSNLFLYLSLVSANGWKCLAGIVFICVCFFLFFFHQGALLSCVSGSAHGLPPLTSALSSSQAAVTEIPPPAMRVPVRQFVMNL